MNVQSAFVPTVATQIKARLNDHELAVTTVSKLSFSSLIESARSRRCPKVMTALGHPISGVISCQ